LALFAPKLSAQLNGFYRDEATGRYGISDTEKGEPLTAPIFEKVFQAEGTESLLIAKTATGFGPFA
jgi:hypothetical protein